MIWYLYRWVWLVVSPLHIGMPPAGALNRTRLYVPARTLWGAFTAELARRKCHDFPDYESTGERLQRQIRLSYLFPAEKVHDRWEAWLPVYEIGKGLMWRREDGEELEDRAFRMRLIITRPGTAIVPESDSAKEGTLREYESISPFWKDKDEVLKQVAMVGYLFCSNEEIFKGILEVEELFIGGDTRYGLGRIKRIIFEQVSTFFGGSSIDPQGTDPVIKTSHVLAHAMIKNREPVGAVERLGFWDMGRGLSSTEPVWVPGTSLKEEREFSVQVNGIWLMR